MADLIELQDLSLTARLAIALRCFASYCDVHSLRHDDIDDFLDYLWEFPLVIGTKRFRIWQASSPDLVGTALGDDWSPEFRQFLVSHGRFPSEFRELIERTVEIVFSSFYAASDDAGSFDHLRRVLDIAKWHGVSPPPLDVFAQSRFVERSGFGRSLTAHERDAWRLTKYT